MRLVGATRWFIRWPFMIEGVVVGFAGGLVAILILWLGKITIVDPLSNTFSFLAAQNNSTLSFPLLVGILFCAAVLVSAVGSGVTLRRFLKVWAGRVMTGAWAGLRPSSALVVALRRALARRPPRQAAGLRRDLRRLASRRPNVEERPKRDRRQLLPRGRSQTELTNCSFRGWFGERCASATTTASPTTSRRRAAKFGEQIAGALLGDRASAISVKKRGCAPTTSSTARRRPGRGSRSATRSSRSTATRSPGRSSAVATPNQRPRGHRGWSQGRGARPEAGEVPAAGETRPGSRCRSRRQKCERAQARLRPPRHLQRRRPRLPAQSGRKGRARRRGGDRAGPAGQRRRPARGGRPDREHLPAEGRGRGHDRLAHPGPRRIPDGRRKPARGRSSS